MKLMVCSSALIIALLSMPPVLAGDSEYLEERSKRLHEKSKITTMLPATTMPRAEVK